MMIYQYFATDIGGFELGILSVATVFMFPHPMSVPYSVTFPHHTPYRLWTHIQFQSLMGWCSKVDWVWYVLIRVQSNQEVPSCQEDSRSSFIKLARNRKGRVLWTHFSPGQDGGSCFLILITALFSQITIFSGCITLSSFSSKCHYHFS